jgi:hypothetical protein
MRSSAGLLPVVAMNLEEPQKQASRPEGRLAVSPGVVLQAVSLELQNQPGQEPSN